MIAQLALFFISLGGVAGEKKISDQLATVRAMDVGRIAFCRPTVLDELQIIGDIRKLTTEETRKLSTILAAEETYFEKLPDGRLKGLAVMCTPHWDIKLLLTSKEGGASAAIRICSSCSQISLAVDGEYVRVPSIRNPAFVELSKLFDDWFPNWRTVTAENKKKWDDDRRNSRL